MRERLIGKQIESCTVTALQARSEDQLKHSQMTPIRAAVTCSKACDTVAEDAFSVASQHSIGLIDIK